MRGVDKACELRVDGVGDGVGGEEICENGGQGVWALLVTSLRLRLRFVTSREKITQHFGLDYWRPFLKHCSV